MRTPCNRACVFAALCLLAGVGDSPASTQTLEMELAWSVLIDDTLAVAGIARSESGRLLLWGPGPALLLVSPEGRRQELRPEGLRHPLAAAFVAGDTVIEVVDGDAQVLLRVTGAGRTERREALGASFRVQSAAHGRPGWYLGGADERRRYHLALRDPAGTIMPLHVFAAAGSDITEAPGGFLTPVDSGVIYAMLKPPFAVVTVSRAGVAETFQAEVPPQPDGRPRPGRWVSLPVLEVGDRLVRTFADLAGEERVLVVYDRSGRVLRASSVSAPLGFVWSSPSEPLLVGLRRSDLSEIVGYRWRWVPESPGEWEKTR